MAATVSKESSLKKLVDSKAFQYTVLVIILANAALLGFETLPLVSDEMRVTLDIIDGVFLFCFIIELGLRMIAYRGAFFKSGWNIFDLIIVGLSALSLSSGISALRAFRVLRVLHVITIMPRMRVVVSSLLDAIPGIASVGVIVLIVVYVFAVVAANLYGADHPDLFGGVFTSMYTLFQVLTLEGWAEIAATVAETDPHSWIFFITFVLVGTFTMLNLFVAIVVRVVDEDSDELEEQIKYEMRKSHQDLLAQNASMMQEITALRDEVMTLRRGMSDEQK
jgi:voltage-gated sodium channel